MEKSEIQEIIIRILIRLFPNLEVDANLLKCTDLIDDLGMDSISFISLIIELEAEFSIRIPDEWLLMERFKEYSAIFTNVEELIVQKEMER